MIKNNFPRIYGVRLGEAEAQYLDRVARENDRSRSAEVRRIRSDADRRPGCEPGPEFRRVSLMNAAAIRAAIEELTAIDREAVAAKQALDCEAGSRPVPGTHEIKSSSNWR